MKKKNYQSPRMKVVEVQQAQIICASTGFRTEQLTQSDFDWDD